MLVSPRVGEPLILYLSGAKEAVSAALIAERDKKQFPVYFISRTLQKEEMNYSMIEKVILSLVFAARRLCRYFQAHVITVLTVDPIRQILMQPE